jgi:hypothetical protein
LNGFLPTRIILAGGIDQLSKDVPKAQEHGFWRNSMNGWKPIQECCSFAQEKVLPLLSMRLYLQLALENHS